MQSLEKLFEQINLLGVAVGRVEGLLANQATSGDIVNLTGRLDAMEGHLRGNKDGIQLAYDEIHEVYDRAVKVLPAGYLGWNWVHALVDALEKQRAAPQSREPRKKNKKGK